MQLSGGRAAWAATLLSVLLLVAAHWPMVSCMGALWARFDVFAYGFVVPLISIWLVWRHQTYLMRVNLGPHVARGLG